MHTVEPDTSKTVNDIIILFVDTKLHKIYTIRLTKKVQVQVVLLLLLVLDVATYKPTIVKRFTLLAMLIWQALPTCRCVECAAAAAP